MAFKFELGERLEYSWNASESWTPCHVTRRYYEDWNRTLVPKYTIAGDGFLEDFVDEPRLRRRGSQ